MNNGKIAIFSSCAGFGTYTPSLNLRDELYEGGIESSVYVFETYFSDEQKKHFLEYRSNFHENFRFATVASDIAYITINNEIITLLEKEDIINEAYDKFIVMYGLWLQILIEMGIDASKIICLRLDVIDTPSWKAVNNLSERYETIWALGRNGLVPRYKFKDRVSTIDSKRVVIHGGGWGINNYIQVLEKISKDYELHVIYSSKSECNDNYFSYYIPLDWIPNKQSLDFPILISAMDNKNKDFKELCANAAAIISKAGGGSCLDVMQFHIPLIYLKGMAKHEDENARHLSKLGYACSFEEWKSTGYSFEKLKEMKKKIDTDMANIKLLRQYLWRNDNASKSL